MTKPKTQKSRHDFFAATPKPSGLFVPEVPIFLQANCAQSGSWVLGEKMLGNELIEIYVLGFQFGSEFDPYKERFTQIGTIWFTPIDSPLTRGLVYAVKIKNQASNRNGSLFNFSQKVAEVTVQGFDPREVIWAASFVKKSGSLPDGTAYHCAVLDFDYRFPESIGEEALLADCVVVLQDDRKLLQLQAASLPGIHAALPEGA